MDRLPALVNEILATFPGSTSLTGTVAWGLETTNSDIDVIVRLDVYKLKAFQNLIHNSHCTCSHNGQPFLNDDADAQVGDSYSNLLGSVKVLDSIDGEYTNINLIVVSELDYMRWVIATTLMSELVGYKLHLTALINKTRRHGVFEILRGVIKSLE